MFFPTSLPSTFPFWSASFRPPPLASSFHLSLWSGSRLACLPLPFICLPGSVLVVGSPAGLSPTSFQAGRFWSGSRLFFLKQFTVKGSQFFLKMCPPFVLVLVSAHFHWPCSISIHLPPRSAASLAKHDPNPQAGVAIRIPAGWVLTVEKTLVNHFAIAACVCYQACSIWLVSVYLPPQSPFPLTMQHFYSAGRVAFLCICLPGLSLLVSALFRWPCSISIRLSPRSVTAGVRVRPFASFVSQACHCWCPPFSAGHVAFLLICLPALHCWFPPFLLAM